MTLPLPAVERMSWPAIKRTLDRDPRLLLGVGALEQAGRHLPLGTNLHITGAVVDAVARRTGILRAPFFPYGVTLKGSEAFAGTAGLNRKTFHRAVNELLANWEDHGVQEFILVTAQPSEAHLEALLMALTSEARTTVFDLPAIAVHDLVDGEPGIEHGGEVETSLLLHLLPEMVSTDQIQDVVPTPTAIRSYRRGHHPTPPFSTGGLLGFATRGSASKGEAIFQRYVDSLVDLLSEAGPPATDSG